MRFRETLVRSRMWAVVAACCLLSVLCSAQYYPQNNGQNGYPNQNTDRWGQRRNNQQRDNDNDDRMPQSDMGNGQGYGQSNVNVTQPAMVEYADAHSATITWRTDVSTPSVVHFGTDPNNLDQTAQVTNNTTMHRVQMLNRFQPGQTYYFAVGAQMGNGAPVLSPVLQFQTPQVGQAAIRQQQPVAVGQYNGNNAQYSNNGVQYSRNRNSSQASNGQGVELTQQPRIEMAGDHSAEIAWSTNVQANTVLHYGTDPNSLTQTAKAPWGGTTHRVTIQNLQPNTTYYFRVVSGQAEGSGSRVRSDVLSFRTVAQGQAAVREQQAMPASQAQGVAQNGMPQGDRDVDISNGPTLEMVGDTSAVVAWSTSAASSAVVHYGTDPNNLSQTAQAPWGGTTHRVTIHNLQPGTHYYFSVVSGQAQGSGTSAGSRTFGFTTVAQGAQPLHNQQPQ